MKKKCPLCPKQYQSNNDLNKHLRRIHGLSVAHIPKYSNIEKSEFVDNCLKLLNHLNNSKG